MTESYAYAPPQVGDTWQEVDPRLERYVRVLEASREWWKRRWKAAEDRRAELEAIIDCALAEDHADVEKYAEIIPKILRRATAKPGAEP